MLSTICQEASTVCLVISADAMTALPGWYYWLVSSSDIKLAPAGWYYSVSGDMNKVLACHLPTLCGVESVWRCLEYPGDAVYTSTLPRLGRQVGLEPQVQSPQFALSCWDVTVQWIRPHCRWQTWRIPRWHDSPQLSTWRRSWCCCGTSAQTTPRLWSWHEPHVHSLSGLSQAERQRSRLRNHRQSETKHLRSPVNKLEQNTCNVKLTWHQEFRCYFCELIKDLLKEHAWTVIETHVFQLLLG